VVKKSLLLLLTLITAFGLFAQTDTIITAKKSYTTTRADKTPKIDGHLDDDAWKNISSITDFRQQNPTYDIEPTQKMEVKIIYDNTAIYIGAMMYDTNPDSIAHQLGNRDDELNADRIRIGFDTYNTQQDGFIFFITASGVQSDFRISDGLYNAVWQSAVSINDRGWSAELRIPYSAIRFPNSAKQVWGLQVVREIIRTGEYIQWSLVPKGTVNPLKYWGIMNGIEDIKPPVRLSFSPYLSAYLSHYPLNEEGQKNYTANYSGGMDIKYGLNESFTLDATLLPDFTQVQSDNIVKNLGAFEVIYQEQRTFFQEGTDLFQKGDLFYSRRIGRRPRAYYSVNYEIDNNETVTKNPDQSKLLNATKVSGRTKSGLGLGFFNAVIDNTYATVKNDKGEVRKILTEPFADYNIIVADQQLKNSSNVYIINTNVSRKMIYSNADVTGVGFNLNNKKNSYGISGNFAASNVYHQKSEENNKVENSFGYKYNFALNKQSGKFQFGVSREEVEKNFDNNEMGITFQTNYAQNNGYLSLSQFEPKGKLLNSNVSLSANHTQNNTTNITNNLEWNISFAGRFRNFSNLNFGYNNQPIKSIDYYEARTPGRILIRPTNNFVWLFYASDYRKKFTYQINIWGGRTGFISPEIGYNPFIGGSLTPNFRVSDKLSLNLNSSYTHDDGDRGFVNQDENSNIIIGARLINSVTNILSVKYLFKNNLSLSFRARHYWSSAYYKSYHILNEDGSLEYNPNYTYNHNFNFNAFNIDMVFQWQFAPGSFANVVWKNSIYQEGDTPQYDYLDNFSSTLQEKQLNYFSLKILYFFDYLYLRKKSKH
jgi:Domain of unknown function (DUF5916)/Carbohydrate family 9 binding domain-like